MLRLLPWKVTSLALGLLAVAAVVTTAEAGIYGNAYQITASSSAGTATFSIPAPSGENYYWHWSTTETIEMRDPSSNNLVATLNPNHEGCSVQYMEDPVIGFAFAVQAGAAPTNFFFSSGSLGFALIPAPEARASAAYTITDFNGDGAVLTPVFGPKSYHATYNFGTVFADLIDPMVAGGFSSATSNQSNPAGPGFIPIAAANEMAVDADFTLSPFDLASGTSVYVIQQRPVSTEPSTWSRIKALTVAR